MLNAKPLHISLFSITAILSLGILVYSNTFYNSFHFDDETSITDNFYIRDIRNIKNIWDFSPDRFITHLSIAFNYHLGGQNVFGYHVFNTLVHLASAILVWWLLILIHPSTKKIAFFASLIFLLHPIQTQPVNYIIQRATLLAAFFYFAALCLYIKAKLEMQLAPKSQIWKTYYAGAILAAIMSVFSKQSAVSLPLSICLYELYYSGEKKNFNWKHIIVFWLVILPVPLIILITKYLNLEAVRTSALYHPQISIWHYFLTQLRVNVTYLRLVFFPFAQNLDYDYSIAKTILSAPVILSLLLLCAIMLMTLKLWRRYKLPAFGIALFFIALLPESSIFPIKDVIFEHRLYLPMAGYSIFLASGTFLLFKQKVKFAIFLLSLLICFYSFMAYQRNKVWKDEFSLWDDTAHKSPHKARPYINRGLAYQNKGNLEQALLDYNKAIEIDSNYAQAYNNRGLLYYAREDFTQAIADYSKAIEIKPNYAKAYYNRATAYAAIKEYTRAIADCNKAIEINPYEAKAYYNRGAAYGAKQEYNRAIADCSKAIEIDPLDAKAYYNRGVIYAAKEEFAQAITDYSQAIKINPGYFQAYNNRGNIYQNKGNYKQAISDYSNAIVINPNLAQAYNNRGLAYYYEKDYANAWEDIQKAQKLGFIVNPTFFDNIQTALGTQRR